MADKLLLNPIYAETDEKDDWIFGFGEDDFELIRQGYACAQCLEIFRIGGMLVAMYKCPLCKRPTALADPERALSAPPEDWVEYLKHRGEVLNDH